MDEFSSFEKPCKKRNGIAFETMRPQNAINLPQFAHEVILRPGETSYQKTVHRFSLEQ
jgi:galactose mutarotase-like enzyme